MTDTDRAILEALAAPYIACKPFPTPASNNEILEELAKRRLHLDLDTLRTHLRGLYQKFGVEEGLNAAAKRVRLCELVYESGVLAPWCPGRNDAPRSRLQRARGQLRSRRRLITAVAGAGVAAVALAVVLASGDDGQRAQRNGDRSRPSGPSGVSVIDPGAMRGARGTVRYCSGRDVSGAQRQAVREFNDEFGAEHLRAVLDDRFSERADLQRQQFNDVLHSRSSRCDVFYLDVIWTAEFAAHRFLYDLTRYVQPRQPEFVAAMLQTARFEGEDWGVPQQLDAPLLFYRTDRGMTRPTSWEAVYREAAPAERLRYQGADYEGLTVGFLEMAYAAGARDVITPDGKANIDQPAVRRALEFMVAGIHKQHAAPLEVTRQKEEGSRLAFTAGRATIMRNWIYAYARLKHDARLAHRFAVSPLPGWTAGGRGVGILGGHNLVISRFTKHPGAALKLVDYLTGDYIETLDATDYALAPTLRDIWDDAAVRRQLPLDAVKHERLLARPVSPAYWRISEAISHNVNLALTGEMSPAEALREAQYDIQEALHDRSAT